MVADAFALTTNVTPGLVTGDGCPGILNAAVRLGVLGIFWANAAVLGSAVLVVARSDLGTAAGDPVAR